MITVSCMAVTFNEPQKGIAQVTIYEKQKHSFVLFYLAYTTYV